MKKLFLAVLVAMGVVPAAFAAVENVKVSGDITMTYLNRQNFDAGRDETAGSLINFPNMYGGLYSQSIWLSQTRLRVDADLTDNVSTTIRLINEAVWDGNYGDGTGSSSHSRTAVDVDLAYVTLREFLYSPLTLTVGRQEIVMGNGFIIGGGPNEFTSGHLNGIANDLSEVIAVDGVKAVLDYRPLTLTMFWYKNAETGNAIQGLYPSHDETSNVFGINANYQLNDPYSTVVETYLFGRFDGKDLLTTGGLAMPTNGHKNDTLFVPGFRTSTNPIKGLNVQGEVAWQLGKVDVLNPFLPPGGITQQFEMHRNAMAAQILASYAVPVLEKYKPTLNAAFTYTSGSKDCYSYQQGADLGGPGKTCTAWDQFGKNQDGGTIYNALFPLSDMYIYSLGASISPLQDVTTAFTWTGLYAAQSLTNHQFQFAVGGGVGGNALFVYQPNQPGNVTNFFLANGNHRQLGNEYDVNLVYNYTEDVTFGLSLGWFVWGDAFSHSMVIQGGGALPGFNPTTASQAIADINVKF